VIVRQERLLVIRRAAGVAAPGMYCFPGGGIEGDESEEQAIVRELDEELGIAVRPVRQLWRSVTERGVDLVWWLATMEPAATIVPNPAEVASVHWFTLDELATLEGLLSGNRRFLETLRGSNVLIG